MKHKAEQYRPFAGGYVSDFERYLNGYLQQHPDVEDDQKRGWYIWWDHRYDPDLLDMAKRNEVPAKGYKYA